MNFDKSDSQVSLKVGQLEALNAEDLDLLKFKELGADARIDLNFLPPLEEPEIVSDIEDIENLQNSGSFIQQFDHFGTSMEDSKKVGIASLPFQKENYSKKIGETFNLMVAGRSGTGKTSFINTLFGTNLIRSEIGRGDANGENININSFDVIEDDFQLKLIVIETSRLGCNINNEGCWLPVSEYVDRQFSRYLFQDQQPDRSLKKDHRVHCCVYILPPNTLGLSPIDIEAMKSLSTKVNLIPIIGKCDSMSREELEVYKTSLKFAFQSNDITCCEFISDEEMIDIIKENFPFSMINGSETTTKPDGTIVRGRKFPWGFVEIENDDHCDFNTIRRILTSDYMLEFILSTEKHYEAFRYSFLNNVINSKSHVFPEDGLEQLKIYQTYTQAQYEEKLRDISPLLLYKADIMKNKLTELVRGQELKFRVWKQALLDKQEELNSGLIDTFMEYSKIAEEVALLEEGIIAEHGTIYGQSKIEKHATFNIDDFLINDNFSSDDEFSFL